MVQTHLPLHYISIFLKHQSKHFLTGEESCFSVGREARRMTKPDLSNSFLSRCLVFKQEASPNKRPIGILQDFGMLRDVTNSLQLLVIQKPIQYFIDTSFVVVSSSANYLVLYEDVNSWVLDSDLWTWFEVHHPCGPFVYSQRIYGLVHPGKV